MTLKEKLTVKLAEVHNKKSAYLKASREYDNLKSEQFDCEHQWGNLLRGFEEEGRICELCDIGEVYWAHNKKQKAA